MPVAALVCALFASICLGVPLFCLCRVVKKVVTELKQMLEDEVVPSRLVEQVAYIEKALSFLWLEKMTCYLVAIGAIVGLIREAVG